MLEVLESLVPFSWRITKVYGEKVPASKVAVGPEEKATNFPSTDMHYD